MLVGTSLRTELILAITQYNSSPSPRTSGRLGYGRITACLFALYLVSRSLIQGRTIEKREGEIYVKIAELHYLIKENMLASES